MTKTAQLMADAKFYESYARYNDKENRYETWEEAVGRVMAMHRVKYSKEMTDSLSNLLDIAEMSYRAKEMLGAQRALQFGGEQLLKQNAKLYNCTAAYCDRSAIFGEAFFLMLCGCGVGFSVQTHHIAKLPQITKRTKQAKTFVVEDSIEGWASSVDALMRSFFVEDSEFKGRKIYFDLTKIRPKGAEISGGFKAPGPEPLRKALDKIEKLIKDALDAGYTNLRNITAYDIFMYIADAVISGGVRRAATICLFSHDDQDMITAKTGDWFVSQPQRGRSNNSAVLLRNETTLSQFEEIMKSVKHSGEPGFVWTDSLEILFNPCVTKDTSVMTSTGPRLVESLIGEQFIAVVNGREYPTSSKGFWRTGTKQIFKLSLDDGSSIKLTDNHKVLTQHRSWVEVKDLTTDDDVVSHNHNNYSWDGVDGIDPEIGWLLGNLVGDGTFSGNSAILRYWNKETYLVEYAKSLLTKHCKTYKEFTATDMNKDTVSTSSAELKRIAERYSILPKNKAPSHKLEETSSLFYSEYLKGLFDADGSVQGSQSKGVSVRLTQNNLETLEQVQRMLLRLGIKSKIYKNRIEEGFYNLPDGHGCTKEFLCKAVHELIISNNSLQTYSSRIGFNVRAKQETLDGNLARYTRALNKDKFYSRVVGVTPVGVEDVYDVTVPGPDAFDANGLYVHNCVEVGMQGYTEDGRSGFQFCNLCEINGDKSTSPEIFYEQCKAAAILGTLQAGYTDFNFVGSATKEIVDREALIGVGITGWMNNPDILFDVEVQRKGAGIVKKWNKIVAKMIGINQAARCCVVKPSGNASVLLGTASGIHGEHSPRYLRHVQMNKDTEVAKLFAKKNPAMIDDSVWTDLDYVIGFPIEPREGSIYKADLLGVKQLGYVKLAQDNWIEYGTNKDLCVAPYLKHNVSNTITVDDWDAVTDYIYSNRHSLCGVSLLSAAGDRAYPQAPFTEVFTHQQIVDTYGEIALFTSALIEAGQLAFGNDLWTAISTAQGFGEVLTDATKDLLKRDWVRRFNKFADNFTNVETCGNCLKDVHNLHKWWSITSKAEEINWVNDLGQKEFVNIDTLGSSGCSGGACEIEF